MYFGSALSIGGIAGRRNLPRDIYWTIPIGILALVLGITMLLMA